MITRQQYFENLNAYRELSDAAKKLTQHPHQQYYAQFVTDEIKSLVKRKFGVRKLVDAYTVDHHFNNIPLKKWDSLGYLIEYLDRKLIKETGQGYSNAGATCILKEAARQLVVESYVDWQEAEKEILSTGVQILQKPDGKYHLCRKLDEYSFYSNDTKEGLIADYFEGDLEAYTYDN